MRFWVWLAIGLLLCFGLWLMRGKVPVDSNEGLLARVLISEASIGNWAEREAVGLTVVNRMRQRATDRVGDVVYEGGFYHYAIDQDPTLFPEYARLAHRLLAGQVDDFTGGATHFFSPYSMPKEGEPTQNFDCLGGWVSYRLPESDREVNVCTPGWSRVLRYLDLQPFGIRPYYFEFYAE